MEKLTIETLKNMKPETIFSSGQTKICHPWVSRHDYDTKAHIRGVVDEDLMTDVKWVAIRGFIHDWAIYHSLDANLVSAINDYYNNVHLVAGNGAIAAHGQNFMIWIRLPIWWIVIKKL